eukprot:gnl/Chilomastix_cuspidata/2743.p1 GENE.gnl/Chilomastix_cuspidata/2743~~gnl/Chilomastix_cuspidata/2743.p1  ORF type:complete len:1016 (-),score=135.67 gnl/Chilomastix_cuspidata/2743:17-3064(-)
MDPRGSDAADLHELVAALGEARPLPALLGLCAMARARPDTGARALAARLGAWHAIRTRLAPLLRAPGEGGATGGSGGDSVRLAALQLLALAAAAAARAPAAPGEDAAALAAFARDAAADDVVAPLVTALADATDAVLATPATSTLAIGARAPPLMRAELVVAILRDVLGAATAAEEPPRAVAPLLARHGVELLCALTQRLTTPSLMPLRLPLLGFWRALLAPYAPPLAPRPLPARRTVETSLPLRAESPLAALGMFGVSARSARADCGRHSRFAGRLLTARTGPRVVGARAAVGAPRDRQRAVLGAMLRTVAGYDGLARTPRRRRRLRVQPRAAMPPAVREATRALAASGGLFALATCMERAASARQLHEPEAVDWAALYGCLAHCAAVAVFEPIDGVEQRTAAEPFLSEKGLTRAVDVAWDIHMSMASRTKEVGGVYSTASLISTSDSRDALRTVFNYCLVCIGILQELARDSATEGSREYALGVFASLLHTRRFPRLLAAQILRSRILSNDDAQYIAMLCSTLGAFVELLNQAAQETGGVITVEAKRRVPRPPSGVSADESSSLISDNAAPTEATMPSCGVEAPLGRVEAVSDDAGELQSELSAPAPSSSDSLPPPPVVERIVGPESFLDLFCRPHVVDSVLEILEEALTGGRLLGSVRTSALVSNCFSFLENVIEASEHRHVLFSLTRMITLARAVYISHDAPSYARANKLFMRCLSLFFEAACEDKATLIRAILEPPRLIPATQDSEGDENYVPDANRAHTAAPSESDVNGSEDDPAFTSDKFSYKFVLRWSSDMDTQLQHEWAARLAGSGGDPFSQEDFSLLDELSLLFEGDADGREILFRLIHLDIISNEEARALADKAAIVLAPTDLHAPQFTLSPSGIPMKRRAGPAAPKTVREDQVDVQLRRLFHEYQSTAEDPERTDTRMVMGLTRDNIEDIALQLDRRTPTIMRRLKRLGLVPESARLPARAKLSQPELSPAALSPKRTLRRASQKSAEPESTPDLSLDFSDGW